MKPGFKTTEFWLTLATQLIALLVLVGVIMPQDRSSLEEALSSAIKAVAALAAQAVTLWKYIQTRRDIKVEEIKETAQLSYARDARQRSLTQASQQ